MGKWLIALIAGYLLGSIPVGFLVVRLSRGVDVRRVGSGRTGGTNVLRAAGWGAAVATGLGDALKGAAAVYLARALNGPPLMQALAGFAAVVGHNYSCFLRLRGGAGTATSVGGAIALWPIGGLLAVPALLAAAFLSRHASVGSISVALFLPLAFAVGAILGTVPWAYETHALLTSALTLWALRPNIRRLARGEERRIPK
ncbi:MAG: glycerol-3-phosphate acyltransferase [Thermoflexales bacterium]|nr:glycerol-3-phosphate acyltransferase [Thermoflexales bacterium]